MIRHALSNGIPMQKISELFESQHKEEYMGRRVQYDSQDLSLRALTGTLHNGQAFPHFSEFEDPVGYNGQFPSAAFCTALALVDATARAPFLATRLMMTTGRVWSVDASFKSAKAIVVQSTRVYLCATTAQNEFGQI